MKAQGLSKWFSIVLCLCVLLTGCGNTGEADGVNSVASGGSVTGTMVSQVPHIEETPAPSELVGWHRSNLDIARHSVEASVAGEIIKFILDTESAYTFTTDAQLEYTDDVNTVVICKDEVPVGLFVISDGMVIPGMEKKWKYTTAQMDMSGGYLSVGNTGVDVFVNEYKATDGLEGVGAFEITMDSENNLNYFIGALGYEKSDKIFLESEKHLMLFLAGEGTLTFDIPDASPLYAYRLRNIDGLAPDDQAFSVCHEDHVVLDVVYSHATRKYTKGSMTEWWYKKGDLFFEGCLYVDTSDEDDSDDIDLDTETTTIDESEEEKTQQGSVTIVITDITLDNRSIYRGQLTFAGSSEASVVDVLDNIDISYAAG